MTVTLIASPIVLHYCQNVTESRVLGQVQLPLLEVREDCTAIAKQWILTTTLHGQLTAGTMKRNGIVDLERTSGADLQSAKPPNGVSTRRPGDPSGSPGM